ncbi:hypothetical protein EBQ34_04990 [Vandammella animalimorsus]|uniref:Uncharacterized protein n=1 Tax=Vandammella animalimorsus TaxID=2029117 RepID=A0A3M6RKE5_9BURK|nr:hypothetical protein EBQ34_04990 [Vandammella animalimorsus]
MHQAKQESACKIAKDFDAGGALPKYSESHTGMLVMRQMPMAFGVSCFIVARCIGARSQVGAGIVAR